MFLQVRVSQPGQGVGEEPSLAAPLPAAVVAAAQGAQHAVVGAASTAMGSPPPVSAALQG